MMVSLSVISFVLLVGITRYELVHGGEGGFTNFLNATSLLYNGAGYVIHTFIVFTIVGLVFFKQKGRVELVEGFKLSLIYLVMLTMIYWVIVYFKF
jgi:hypothetical protein